MEAVGVIQQFDGETVAEIDEERQRRIDGSGRPLDDFQRGAAAVPVRLGADFLDLAILFCRTSFIVPQPRLERLHLIDRGVQSRLQRAKFGGGVIGVSCGNRQSDAQSHRCNS